MLYSTIWRVLCFAFSMPSHHVAKLAFFFFLREKIEKINIQSRIVQDSEPARNQSFTELISELRAARVGICQACLSHGGEKKSIL